MWIWGLDFWFKLAYNWLVCKHTNAHIHTHSYTPADTHLYSKATLFDKLDWFFSLCFGSKWLSSLSFNCLCLELIIVSKPVLLSCSLHGEKNQWLLHFKKSLKLKWSCKICVYYIIRDQKHSSWNKEIFATFHHGHCDLNHTQHYIMEGRNSS